jgi:hypothetical protein
VAPAISVVVVAYDMARELPRTLQTLSVGFQRGLSEADYEVIVVDNGSPEPMASVLQDFPAVRSARLDPAPVSPAAAANLGLEMAEGELVGLIVDGARMATPGLLDNAQRAARLFARPIVASVAYHLGKTRHMDAAAAGYDQQAEDELLSSILWRDDGYELFRVSTLAGSSVWGWFRPLAESSALFMPRVLWNELGGLDPSFALPGGGLVNHDLYRRACELEQTRLVVLLGEGTFHQYHGGAATSRRFSFEDMQAEYVALRGGRYRAPRKDPYYLGRIPDAALAHLAESARLALDKAQSPSSTSPTSSSSSSSSSSSGSPG